MSPGQLIDTIEGQRATIAALESRITELQARLHAAGIAGHLLAGALFPVGRSVDPPTEAAKTAGNAMIDQALARARRPPAANSPRGSGSDGARSAAERMQAHRHRRRIGLEIYAVEVSSFLS